MKASWVRADQSGIVCHTGPVEIVKNLFCGSMFEVFDMVSDKISIDTLIPLYAVDGWIWDLGFRGEIMYYPIRDYGTLPDDVLKELVAKILVRLSDGKRIGLCCFGGHGRTGYIASIVLGRLGYEDPIGFLRSNYCKQAVESNAQIRHIAAVLDKPNLARMYVTKDVY